MLRHASKDGKTADAVARTKANGVPGANPGWTRRDEDLLAEYVEKLSPVAFEELVHRYERELYSYLYKYLRNAQLAEDAFQATFLQVHLKRRQFDPCQKFRPWLYKVATNQAIDLMRRNRRHRTVSLNAVLLQQSSNEEPIGQILSGFHDADPGERLEIAEDREKMRAVVARFPARLKGVLDLIVFQGFKYQEAADALRIPLGSVKSRLHEAVVRLRRTFQAPMRADSRDNPRPHHNAVRAVESSERRYAGQMRGTAQ
jgi:RNA polymerase sigma-70 factor, ECF subfamily